MKQDKEHKIVVRAFFETGKDGLDSLYEYIDKLERTCLSLDKIVSKRGNRRSITRLYEVLREYS